MKHYLLFFALILAFKAGAQISLEHTYSGQGSIAHLEFQDEKYALLEASDYRCRIYHADHSLYKTVNLQVPGGCTINSIQHVTDGLFNTDALIEFSYTCYLISGSNVVYETRVANENGQVLLTVSGASAAYVDYIGDSWKFIAWIYDYSSTPAEVNTKVYSLPGHLITTVESMPEEHVFKQAFPNPAVESITLFYKLPAGSEGRMLISNSKGQIIKILSLGSGFDNILFPVHDLPDGVYFYTTEGGTGSGNFIVVK